MENGRFEGSIKIFAIIEKGNGTIPVEKWGIRRRVTGSVWITELLISDNRDSCALTTQPYTCPFTVKLIASWFLIFFFFHTLNPNVQNTKVAHHLFFSPTKPENLGTRCYFCCC